MTFSKKDLEAKGLVEIQPGYWSRPKRKHKYGAVAVVEGGEKFDSKREYFFKQLLDSEKISYQSKHKIILQHGFKYGKETIRPVAIIPDFGILNGPEGKLIAIVDVKGMITPEFKIKWKMLKWKLINLNHEIPLFVPHNKQECHQVIQSIKILLGRS